MGFHHMRARSHENSLDKYVPFGCLANLWAGLGDNIFIQFHHAITPPYSISSARAPLQGSSHFARSSSACGSRLAQEGMKSRSVAGQAGGFRGCRYRRPRPLDKRRIVRTPFSG